MQYFSSTTHVFKNIILAAGVISAASIFLAVPQHASAYNTTAQSATLLSDNTFLFQITYRLNFMNRDFRTPVLARRVAAPEISVPEVQYSLRDAEGEILTNSLSTAIVLSDAEVEDDQYYLPERTPGFFTLVAVVQLPDEVVAAGGETALQIDWLPFTLINDGESQLARIPAADLTDYRTPMITW